MRTFRHTFHWTIVAFASLAVGLLLLARSAGAGQSGTFLPLAALLLIIYGVVLTWWRVEAAAPAVQTCVARMMRRVRGQAFR